MWDGALSVQVFQVYICKHKQYNMYVYSGLYTDLRRVAHTVESCNDTSPLVYMPSTALLVQVSAQ